MTDEKTAVSPQPQAPAPLSQPATPEKKDRTPFWLLLAVIVGFMLAVCSCGVLLATGEAIEPVHLDPAPAVTNQDGSKSLTRLSFGTAKARVIDAFEKEYLLGILAECGGNVTEAAARAQTERRTIGRLMKKHGIQRSAA